MEINKKEVLNFFKNHIIRYVVTDLEILNKIEAYEEGVGGCAIPQASSTFSALDLIGYLIHPKEDIRPMKMNFLDFLKIEKYFPELSDYKSNEPFLNSIRDYIRTFLAHRYLMTKYDVAKIVDIDKLFIVNEERIVFNVSFFTKITIKAIKDFYSDIINDQFSINGYSNEKSIKMVKEKLDKLKLYDFEGKKNVELTGLTSSTVSVETTRSIDDRITNQKI